MPMRNKPPQTRHMWRSDDRLSNQLRICSTRFSTTSNFPIVRQNIRNTISVGLEASEGSHPEPRSNHVSYCNYFVSFDCYSGLKRNDLTCIFLNPHAVLQFLIGLPQQSHLIRTQTRVIVAREALMVISMAAPMI